MPSLSSYHSFHLDTNCSSVLNIEDVEQLTAAVASNSQFYLLGEGSNTIFLEDFFGTVIVNRIAGIQMRESSAYYHLRVGAGENWHQLVSTALNNGWYGMENLALIPGSVGASPIQNIGAYGLEVGNFIESVEIIDLIDGTSKILTHQECLFDYRDSVFKNELAGRVVVTHVNFVLPKKNTLVTSYGELARLSAPSPRKIFDEVIRIRQEKLPDPNVTGNAGSFFKNPVIAAHAYQTLQVSHPSIPGFKIDNESVKVPAAWLIDQCGFKGRRVGDVSCHPNQPLVLTNQGKARGEDVVALAREIMNEVLNTFDITLEPEVRLVGKEGLITL